MGGVDHRSILVVEDSPEDFEALNRAFQRVKMVNPVRHCVDGDDAIDYLHKKGKYEGEEPGELPSLVILDLNMPGTDGHEVLNMLKSDPDLSCIPVIVLTTSSDKMDIRKCYDFGANSYIQKPVGLDGFVDAIQRLKDFWIELAILPEEKVREEERPISTGPDAIF